MCLNMHLKRRSLCLRACQPLQQLQQDRVDPEKKKDSIQIHGPEMQTCLYDRFREFKPGSQQLQHDLVLPSHRDHPVGKKKSNCPRHPTLDTKDVCIYQKTQQSAAKLLLTRALTAGPTAPAAPLLPSGPGTPYAQEE